ncbi:MAG TPA: HDIG domain-containing protein [Gemmatimonadaceae bacterium]|nr:HDIG domain-containing protein [Gemmatimonadaceae bacterium]
MAVSRWQELWRAVSVERPDDRSGARALYHGARVGVGLGVALFTYALFPASPSVDFPLYEVGSVATDNVIAPFELRVRKSDTELARERDALAQAAQPIFVLVPEAADSARAALQAFAAALPGDSAPPTAATALAIRRAAEGAGVRLAAPEAAYLAQAVRRRTLLAQVDRAIGRWLGTGVVAGGVLDNVRGSVVVRGGESQRSVDADSLLSFGGYVARARLIHPDPDDPAADALYTKLLTASFRPSIVLDRAATLLQREELRRSVEENKFEVRAGEKIVGAHEVVGREEYEKLRALQEQLQRRNTSERGARRAVGTVLFNFLVIAVFGATLVLFRPRLYASLRALAFCAAVFVLTVAGAALVARFAVEHPELLPVALAAILLSVLFDARVSMIAAVVLAVLIGGQSVFRGTNALFLAMIGGVAAALSVRVIRRRKQTWYSVAAVAGAYLLAAVAIGLTLEWPAAAIAETAALGFANAVLSVVLGVALIPLAEEISGIDTYFKLLEWSDLNGPLMQRLSLEAPGTFAHTIAIANLAEAAANAIGGNALLARVGAYYHDIGKLKKPQYFVENQARGRNPHDKLKPATSAQIIRNHVREGLDLAEEYRLPRQVRAFIAEHHGTAPISYFLEKAKERDGAVGNPADYAYPGPIPQSAETAIVMLADGVEAATKVLHEPTPQKIRDVVEHIVRLRIDAGQLRDAPLTLRQLEVIKEQFARVLVGMYHSRIDYPAASGGVTSEFASV